MDIKEFNIELPKMDYTVIELSIKENGVNVKLQDNDNLYFTIKRNSSDTEPIIQKSLNNGITYNDETQKYEIEILSSDTKELTMGDDYGFDITIYYGGDKPKQKVIGKLKIGTKYTLNEVM